MGKTIDRAEGYFYQHIINVLEKGLQTAIPKDILEKEGLPVNELGKYFHIRQGPFGLIHFLGIKKQI